MKGKICCLHRLIIKIVRCNIKCWYIHMLNYLFGCNLSVFQLCVIFDMCYNSSSCSTINHSNSICLSVLPSINLPPTFRHWVWCQLSCGIRLRNIHHLVQLCLFYFLRWFMKVMDWCKVFGLCTHTPSCSIFFFQTLLYWKAGTMYPLFHILLKEKKSYHKALIVRFECSLQQKSEHTNRQEKFTVFIFYWLYPASWVSSQLLRACLREVVRRAAAVVW